MKSTPPLSKRRWLTLAAAFLITGLRAVSAADYPTTVLADNPLAFWRLNETPGIYTAADSSASGIYSADYIYSPDSAYPILGQPGIDTNSISLSGSDTPDYAVLPYNPDLNQPGPFSFEIWIRPTSIPTGGNYRCPIGNSAAYDTATQSGWYVYQTPDSPSELALVTPTGDVFITTTNYTTFKWYYIAGTYDGTNMSFYLNGALVGSQRANAYVANSVANPGVPNFALGQRGDGYGNFDGGLDDAAFYTNALSGTQILTHYTVGTNSFRAGALPPTILTEPAVTTTVYAGKTANFSVQADGTSPLAYQWYNTTAAISGATSSTYSFTTAPTDDGSSYYVVVTNSVGSVTSSPAMLSVSTGLLIDAPLTSITREVGSSAAFEVVAEGALPITYQWHNGDSSIIPGATNSVLWLSNVQLTNDGASYYVDIINPYTDIDSSPATLNVNARAVTVATNGYASVVLADGPVGYWRLDETSGPTATDAAGSFDGTYTPGAGSFTFGAPTGIPHDTDGALGVAGGATVQIPYALEINPTGPFSVEGWFQASSAATGGNDYRVPFSSMSNPYGEGPTGWLVYQTAGNNWSWWPYNGYYGGVQLTDNDQVVANQWYYLTLVYDGTTFTFYVDGVAEASGTDSGFVQNGNVPAGGAANYNYNYNTTPGLPTGSGNMVLGQRVDDAFNPFLGAIDDVAVYNKALTTQQIQNHFLNTTHLTISAAGSSYVVSWSAGTLQSSTNLAGPFVNVSGAGSPYTNSISGKQLFFRAQLQ